MPSSPENSGPPDSCKGRGTSAYFFTRMWLNGCYSSAYNFPNQEKRHYIAQQNMMILPTAVDCRHSHKYTGQLLRAPVSSDLTMQHQIFIARNQLPCLIWVVCEQLSLYIHIFSICTRCALGNSSFSIKHYLQECVSIITVGSGTWRFEVHCGMWRSNKL
jgi:hypothetical protein